MWNIGATIFVATVLSTGLVVALMELFDRLLKPGASDELPERVPTVDNYEEQPES